MFIPCNQCIGTTQCMLPRGHRGLHEGENVTSRTRLIQKKIHRGTNSHCPSGKSFYNSYDAYAYKFTSWEKKDEKWVAWFLRKDRGIHFPVPIYSNRRKLSIHLAQKYKEYTQSQDKQTRRIDDRNEEKVGDNGDSLEELGDLNSSNAGREAFEQFRIWNRNTDGSVRKNAAFFATGEYTEDSWICKETSSGFEFPVPLSAMSEDAKTFDVVRRFYEQSKHSETAASDENDDRESYAKLLIALQQPTHISLHALRQPTHISLHELMNTFTIELQVKVKQHLSEYGINYDQLIHQNNYDGVTFAQEFKPLIFDFLKTEYPIAHKTAQILCHD